MDLKLVLCFAASFVVGLVLVYYSPIEHKTVFVYPTPSNEKKIQYKSQFDYITFILGTPTCKETEHDIPYLDALKAAFTSYK